jgi:hypothetical protein
VTILYASLNCLRLATYVNSREQDRPTLSRTGREPRIVSVAPDEPFPEIFTLGGRHQTRPRLGRIWRLAAFVSFPGVSDVLSGNSGGDEGPALAMI